LALDPTEGGRHGGHVAISPAGNGCPSEAPPVENQRHTEIAESRCHSETGSSRQPLLSEPDAARLFRDIRRRTHVIAVQARRGLGDCVETEPVSLGQAWRLLMARTVPGVEIRYIYQGLAWRDLLLTSHEGFRLIRARAR
jgi:hypothetical protein